jgi:uncharacterized membrane protein YfcA
MVAVGALRYKLDPDIDVSVTHAALIAVGGVAGAFVGVEMATRLPGSVLSRIFACFIIAVGLRMLIAPGGSSASAELASRSAEKASAGIEGRAPPEARPAPTGVEETEDDASR